MSYPDDEFDRLEPTGRKGAHRRQTRPTSQAGAVALIAVLAIAAVLLVFGAVRIIGASTSDPEQQVAQTPTATRTDSPSPTETEVAVVDKTASVSVLNASGVAGAAAKYADALEQAGWDIASTTNYSTTETTSTVYYANEDAEVQAQAMAEELGLEQVEQSEEFSTDLTLVICSDIADQEPQVEPTN